MKTPEQMAEEYLDQDKVVCAAINRDAEDLVKDAFLAGYQAAKDETNLPTPAKWISVKERLPEDGIEVLFYSPEKEMNCCFVGYKATKNEYVDPEGNGLIARQIEKYYTHWMPLPAPPKEEK